MGSGLSPSCRARCPHGSSPPNPAQWPRPRSCIRDHGAPTISFRCAAPQGAQRCRGLVAGIDVHEDRALGAQRERQAEVKVAAYVPGGTPVGPLGQDPALDPERLERGDLLGLGREPRQAGTVEEVVERQQPTHEHGPERDPARPMELPGAERPVHLEGLDPAHAADPVDADRRGLLDGQALRDEGEHGAPHLLRVATQETRPLRAGEDAAVQTGQGDPLGPASGPAKGLQSVLASLEMGDQSGRPWLKDWPCMSLLYSLPRVTSPVEIGSEALGRVKPRPRVDVPSGPALSRTRIDLRQRPSVAFRECRHWSRRLLRAKFRSRRSCSPSSRGIE